MANYKDIKGFKVQYLGQDPVPAVAAWSSGGAIPKAVIASAGAGISTAGLVFGGEANPGGQQNLTHEYDGSSYSSGGALSLARSQLGGCGTQTAALAFGGSPPLTGTSEEYGGSSWTSGGTMGTARYIFGSAGTQTAALAYGGFNATASQTATEEYD